MIGPIKSPELNLHILCSQCRHLADTFASWPKRPKDNVSQVFKHHTTLDKLRDSAHAGCHLCYRLLPLDCEPAEPRHHASDDDTYNLKMEREIGYESEDEGWIEFNGHPRLNIRRGRIQNDEKVASSTIRFRRTDAFEVLQQARGWIHQCKDHHTTCRARDSDAEGSGFVPTRLIRVNTVDCVLKSVRLLERGEIDPKSKYLTLSHCWGAAKSILLEQNSLTKFRSGIPLAQLPKTFKDAMLVTTQLGYEFVWIDSLCIIQDSNEDWLHESALMGEIYRNSGCTIAALGAKDSNGGCFQERCALSFLGCQFGPDFIILGETQQDWLHSRAWVLQERCLATRTLNFGAHFVSYDCIEGSNDERNWTQQMPTLKGRYSQLTIRNRGPRTKIEGEWRDSWLDDWWRILWEYTKCNLTYISDKWTAIQGLATNMADLNNVNIINGLWEPALAQELLWVADTTKSSRLSIGWPSWSWLSIDGAVSRPFVHKDTRCLKIIDAKVEVMRCALCTFRASNRRSDCSEKSHELRVTGYCFRIDTPPDSDANRPAFRSESDYLTSYLPGTRSLPSSAHDLPSMYRYQLEWWKTDTVPQRHWDTWALQIIRRKHLTNDTGMGSVGLVIVPVNGKENRWQRVGLYDDVQYSLGDPITQDQEPSSLVDFDLSDDEDIAEKKTIMLV